MKEQGVPICFEAARAQGTEGLALLIGAGCSRSSGIFTATEMVNEIRNQFPTLCADLPTDEAYAHATERLSEAQWRRLFGRIVGDAKLNIAHLCIGALVGNGIVDRILTTNFDSLLLQSCALWERFPIVHDCSVADPLDDLDDWLDEPGSAIFYLHGHDHGRKMLNPRRLELLRSSAAAIEAPKSGIEELIKKRGEVVSQTVKGTVRRRPLIVCGYSGRTDHVLKTLQSLNELPNPVFWIAYNDEDARYVLSQVRKPELEYRFFVITRPDGLGADEFFYELLLATGVRAPMLERHEVPETRLAEYRIARPEQPWEGWLIERMRCAGGSTVDKATETPVPFSQLSIQQETPLWAASSS